MQPQTQAKDCVLSSNAVNVRQPAWVVLPVLSTSGALITAGNKRAVILGKQQMRFGILWTATS